MLTLIGYAGLAVVIAGLLFVLAANFLPAGEQIAPPLRDEAPWELPAARPLDSAEIAGVRLPVALRGYRFRETDALLDRLAEEIRCRDEEITQLRAGRSVPTPDRLRERAPDAEPGAEPDSAPPDPDD